MQTAIAVFIVLAAVGVLTFKLWRAARAGTSCSCSAECRGCDGCPALRASNTDTAPANE